MNIPKRASRHHFMRRSWLPPKAFSHSGGGGAFTVADSATAFSVEPSAGALAGGAGAAGGGSAARVAGAAVDSAMAAASATCLVIVGSSGPMTRITSRPPLSSEKARPLVTNLLCSKLRSDRRWAAAGNSGTIGPQLAMASRRGFRIGIRYALGLLREFRWTLLGLALTLAVGATLYTLAPAQAFASPPPDLPGWPLLVAWMNLFGEPLIAPQVWYLAAVEALFPLVGFVLIGEGIIRLGILLFSRRLGEKEWMTVMASTFRDHIIICGLGHLGFRLLGQLRARDEELVVIERDPACGFLGRARDHGAAVLVRDMRDDQALRDAGIDVARVIVVASNDDLANIEVALDARRMNPGIRILLRLFDQRIADKFKDLGVIDEAFSSAALAAPAVAELALQPPRPGRPR